MKRVQPDKGRPHFETSVEAWLEDNRLRWIPSPSKALVETLEDMGRYDQAQAVRDRIAELIGRKAKP